MLKIYADNEHYRINCNTELNDIVQASWNNLSADERLREFGSRAANFNLTPSVDNADICLLPMKWSYYVDNNCVRLANDAVEKAHEAGKKIVIFNIIDSPANIPFSSVVLMERSAHRTRRFQKGNRIFALPAFTGDYLQLYCNNEIQIRDKRTQPLVGFCGQAGGSRADFIRRYLNIVIQQTAYKSHLRKWEPPPFDPARFRRRILEILGNSQLLSTNFIIRNRYRAGYRVLKKDPFHPTRMEFIRNILETDYTLCIRGSGNYSVRFYEALALGRIPIFVDTDCLLPYDNLIDYSQKFVRIDAGELSKINERIIEFHGSLSNSDFRDLQIQCRRLWLDYFSMDGFYLNFHKHFID